MLSRAEVIERLCKLQEEVSTAIGYEHPADCFCKKGGLWQSPSYDESSYQNAGKALAFIERAVRQKIKQRQKRKKGKS